MKWSLSKIWNESLEQRAEKEIKARDHLWASEIGNAFVDQYLKMTGVKPSNPANPRSLRKFEAGNIWEWIVGLVLLRAGILQSKQKWVEVAYPGLLRVSGKMDFMAGGEIDWNEAKARVKEDIENLMLPEFIAKQSLAIVNYFSENYPEGLDEAILEIKTVSSFMFERYERTQIGERKHKYQLFHYLKGENKEEGHIVYICKDDARMLEIGIMNPSPVEDEYKSYIEKMTDFINTKTQPDKEQELLFDEDTMRFNKNWRVAYSNYLTYLYGYKDQLEYDSKYDPIVARWNRVLGRCIKGDTMTKLNLEVIEEIKKQYPDFDNLVDKARKSNVVISEEEENA